MLLLLTAVFLLKRYDAQATPIPVPAHTSGTLEAPLFFTRDDPSDACHGRTVLDILWSCLATTFACTWVSVHPNVPFKGEGKWPLLGRRLFLMFFSILAPEFMIMWAFKQWRCAVKIREAINEAIKEASPDPQNPIRRLWTTTHGHFLQMGGFRLRVTQRENFFLKGLGPMLRSVTVVEENYWEINEIAMIARINSLRSDDLIRKPFHYRHENSEGSWSTDYNPDNELKDDVWEGVLTIDALKQLLTENLIAFPAITEDEINDKSKGDALSKGVALLQLTWFIVQIITRAAQGLAITELELTTVALAGLNSVMYIFWWSKPRDVRFPVVIQTKGVEELMATKAEDVMWNFPYQEFDFRRHLWTETTKSINWLLCAIGRFFASLPGRVTGALPILFKRVKAFSRNASLSVSQIWQYLVRIGGRGKNGKDAGRRRNRHEWQDVGLEGLSEGPERIDLEVLVETHPPSPILSNSHSALIKTIIRTIISVAIKLATLPIFSLLYLIDIVMFIPIIMVLSSEPDSLRISHKSGFDTKAKQETYFMMFFSEDADFEPILGTCSIAGVLFGAIHCLAWHFSFPSHVEQVLWRTASLGIVGFCAVFFYTSFMFHIGDTRPGDLKGLFVIIFVVLGSVPFVLAVFAYPVSRIALFVLAISSLRSLPPSAFDTVNWVEFAPHI